MCLMPALALASVANLLLAATFGAQEAHACTCAPPPGVEEALQRADAVFSGKVIGGLAGPTTFDVEEAWKGVSENQVTVDGRQSSDPGVVTSCDLNFRGGERYLVYAGRGGQGEDALLQTSLCSRTKLLSKAEADLQALGPAALTLPGSVEPEASVEPESVDSTPVSGTWSGWEQVVAVASAILLLLVAVGAFTFWRWRRRPG